MKKFFLILVMFSFMAVVSGQSVLLHKEVNDSVTVKFGPNLKNFIHFYFGVGFIAGEPDSAGSSIIQGYSMNLLIGYRYKLRLTNWFALGYELAFNSYSYRLKQDSTKITPNKTIHDKEKLTFSDLGTACYLRFNYGRRGNRIGNFIDIGGYADWIFSGRNYYKDKKTNGNIFQTTISHLNYFDRYNYGALARLGFNRYVFYGYYRLSDIFDTSYLYPELPRLTIGLQIGLHK